MSDSGRIADSVFFSAYRADTRRAYEEVCGKGGDEAATLDRFLESLASPGKSYVEFFASLKGKDALPAAYRLFLAGGRNCPKESAGRLKWEISQGVNLTSSEKIASGSDLFAEEFVSRVSKISDPGEYVSAWEEYALAIIRSVSLARTDVDSLLARQEAGEKIGGGDLVFALKPLLKTFDASKAFERKLGDPIRETWDFHFVDTQAANFSNLMSGISPYLDLFDSGFKTDGMVASIASNLLRFFEPFYHIHYSYVVDRGVGSHLSVEAPPHMLRISPANPAAMRLLIDGIIYHAARVEGAKLKVDWNEKTRTISFLDESEKESALQAFSNMTGELSPLLFNAFEGQGFHISPSAVYEGRTGRVTMIEFVIPGEGENPGNPARAERPAESTAAKKLDEAVEEGCPCDARSAMEEVLLHDEYSREVWSSMTEEQREKAIEELKLLADDLDKRSFRLLGKPVYRSVIRANAPAMSIPPIVK